MVRRRSVYAFAALVAASLITSGADATSLRASHQFPGGKNDVRDEMVQMIAREVKAANVDLDIHVYPGATLFKPNEQWNAMVTGQLDISSFPLDYASGKVPAFGATLMPGLVRSHERAQRLDRSPFMRDIRARIEAAGVVVLSDAWLAGAVASRGRCIRDPADVRGMRIRSAGQTFAQMWEKAGAVLVSIPSNEIYNALQTGLVDATDTSTGSFTSFRLYEQVKCITAPGENALWFMYEPVLMSKKSFDRLTDAQRAALVAAGDKAAAYFAEAAKSLDDEMVKTFEAHHVEVVTMTQDEYASWIEVAKASSYKEFAAHVPGGMQLIDEALAVK